MLDNDEDVQQQFIHRNINSSVFACLPFDQQLKRKTFIRKVDGQSDVVRIYVKGAPEWVIPLCTQTFDAQMNSKEFNETEQNNILQHIVSQEMAMQGLKVISYAYKEITMDSFNQLMSTMHVESDEFRAEAESDLVYVATFGLEDPLREDIDTTVQLIRYGHKQTSFDNNENYQVNVRMITGDHVDTAREVAFRCGIITEEEKTMDNVVITSQQFREAIGDVQQIYDPVSGETKIEFLEGRKKFDEIKKAVKVIARCTSEDKFIFVCGIKQKGGLVGMTGDSISDAEALIKADVGFCMGSGCDVAKDNSDLVILDNDFVSIYRSIKWGRAIFDNVRKFLQFQLTMNIVVCVVTIVGGFTLGVPPLNVVQMLWANLIMDILGAIAIGTEPYNSNESGTSNRISRKDSIIKPEMMRLIICHSIY